MSPLKIIIADDHQMFIDGLSSILAGYPDIQVVAAVKSYEDLLSCMLHKSCDIIISESKIFGADMIMELSKIKKQLLTPQVIFLISGINLATVKVALAAGVNACLFKQSGKEELIKAIRKVANGECYLGEAVVTELTKDFSERSFMHEKDIEKNIHITDRELDIIKLIVEEYNNTQIATKLYISPKTVETHRKNIMKKLGVHNSAGLIKYALRNNIIDVEQFV